MFDRLAASNTRLAFLAFPRLQNFRVGSTKSPEREQKKRWFRNGQKWRTGCEGRISVVKRRHGLDRCRYKGFVGMQRWVGLGVIADNIVNIGRTMEKRASRASSVAGVNGGCYRKSG